MIPEKFIEILKYEGVVAIVTKGANEPHVVNTWNSYIQITDDGKLLGPVGGMKTTEANLKSNNKVLITIGSREVQGFYSKGTGFLITGTAEIVTKGKDFDIVLQRFPWARAALVIKPESFKQTL